MLRKSHNDGRLIAGGFFCKQWTLSMSWLQISTSNWLAIEMITAFKYSSRFSGIPWTSTLYFRVHCSSESWFNSRSWAPSSCWLIVKEFSWSFKSFSYVLSVASILSTVCLRLAICASLICNSSTSFLRADFQLNFTHIRFSFANLECPTYHSLIYPLICLGFFVRGKQGDCLKPTRGFPRYLWSFRCKRRTLSGRTAQFPPVGDAGRTIRVSSSHFKLT